MADLTELRQMQEDYINEQAQKIVDGMVKRKVVTDTLATCDYPNWDRQLHRTMPQIASKLREMGLSVTSSVNHGVTDWVFVINV